MRTPGTARSLLASALPLSLLLANACAADDTSDSIGNALEQPNAGLDMTDEAPNSDQAALDQAAIEPEAVVVDEMASDPAVTTMMSTAGAAKVDALILWGQMPPDRLNPNVRHWDGTFALNRGALVVKRTIGFEDATDSVAPRTDPLTLSFVSRTRPFADGLALAIVDDPTASSGAQTLTYTPATGAAVTVNVADLLTVAQTTLVDDGNGNRMVAAAMAQPAAACDHGFLRGRWHDVADGRGRILGKVTNADLEPIGHIRGIYGVRANGDQVFGAKYLGLDGKFEGILLGRYADGKFDGRWKTRAGDRGVVRGEYREPDAAAADAHGYFIGRWADKSCGLDLGTDPPTGN